MIAYAVHLANHQNFVYIYVDLNGYKNPNRSGVDLFTYTLTTDSLFDGYEYLTNKKVIKSRIGLGAFGEMLSNYVNVGNYKCGNTTSWPILDTCGMLIKRNNWKIPNDYPAKI